MDHPRYVDPRDEEAAATVDRESRRPPVPGYEVFVATQTVATVVLVSWSYGGMADWVSWLLLVMTLPGWLAVRASLKAGVAFRWVPYLPWLLYLGYSVLAYLNPSHVVVEDEGWNRRDGWISWLPTILDWRVALPNTLVFFSVLQQAGFIAHLLRSRRARNRLQMGLLCNGLALALVGLYFHSIGAVKLLGVAEMPAPYFFATFVYKNHWAAFAILNAALAAGVGFRVWERAEVDRRESGVRLFAFVAFALIVFTAPIPDSRAGLALMLPLVLSVVAAMALRLYKNPEKSETARRVTLGAFAVVAIGLGAWMATVLNPVVQGFLSKTESQISAAGGSLEAPVAMRLLTARDTLKMAADRPLWGWGQGSFVHVFQSYQGDYNTDAAGNRVGSFWAAHCDYAQFPAEMGYVGFGILLLPTLWQVYRGFAERVPFQTWTTLGVLLVMVAAVGEFPFQNPAIVLMVAVLLALNRRRSRGYPPIVKEASPV